MAGIFSQGGSAGHRHAGWLEQVEAKNFQFGGKVFNGSPSAIYVGSNLVWAGRWLTVAAAQAIIAAFGQTDGKAVIKATNAYLNQLAASDRDKATALAGFINEDPMMVCSLGLSGVQWRYLKGDYTAYINTKFNPTGDIHISCLTKNGFGTKGSYCVLFGASSGTFTSLNTNAWNYGSNTDRDWGSGASTGKLFEANKGALSVDGTIVQTWSQQSFTVNRYMFIYADNNGSARRLSAASIAYMTIERGDNMLYDFRPFRLGKAWSADKVSTGVAQAKDTLGMIDLVTGIFYPNAASSGAFTMEGEPTPSTP